MNLWIMWIWISGASLLGLGGMAGGILAGVLQRRNEQAPRRQSQVKIAP